MITEVLKNFNDLIFLIFFPPHFVSIRLIPIFTNLNTFIASLKFSQASVENFKNIKEKMMKIFFINLKS